MRWLKLLFISLAAGLFLGIGGRLVMWVIARVALGSGGFSFGGTLEVIATGLLFGVPGALIYALLRSKIGKPAVWKGALFGLLFIIVIILVPPPAAVSASSGLRRVLPLTLSLFGILFVVYGMIVESLLKNQK